MSKIESVMSVFRDDLDCAQALVSTYGPGLGLDREIAIKVADAFGGGIGRTWETCGAVTGALMVMGLKYGEKSPESARNNKGIHKMAKDFISRFASRNGSILCRELLERDISNPDTYNSKETLELFRDSCPKYVRDAAEIIEELIEFPE